MKLALAAFLLLALGHWALAASKYKSIVCFGDSFNDSGAYYKRNGGVSPASPPYARRSSNGPVWVEGAAASAGAVLLGLAESGAVACNASQLPFSQAIGQSVPARSVQEQVAAYLKGLPRKTVGDASRLHTFNGGDNDIAGIAILVAIGAVKVADVQPLVAAAAACVSAAAEALLKRGAKTVVVSAPLNQALVPSARLLGKEAVELFQYLWSLQDAEVRGALRALSARNPGVLEGYQRLLVWEVNAFIERTSNASGLGALPGITEFKKPCCYNPASGTCAAGSVCARPASHYWWDQPHPTEVVHRAMAANFFNRFLKA